MPAHHQLLFHINLVDALAVHLFTVDSVDNKIKYDFFRTFDLSSEWEGWYKQEEQTSEDAGYGANRSGRQRGKKLGSVVQIDKYGFALTWGWSRMRYVEFTRLQDVETLLNCMVHAFAYFGGVTVTVLTDNMKTVVVDRSTANHVSIRRCWISPATTASCRGPAIRIDHRPRVRSSPPSAIARQSLDRQLARGSMDTTVRLFAPGQRLAVQLRQRVEGSALARRST